jgi:hypothetical protein
MLERNYLAYFILNSGLEKEVFKSAHLELVVGRQQTMVHIGAQYLLLF